MKKLLIFTCIALISLGACSKSEKPKGEAIEQIALTVYKDPNCGCCGKWIDHLEDNKFLIKPVNHNEMFKIKEQYGVDGSFQSCHTGISKDGFVFEGHIPAKYIQRFLKERPENALGLTVPSMPLGTPGMEKGQEFQPYKIYLLRADGYAEVYADISSIEMQY